MESRTSLNIRRTRKNCIYKIYIKIYLVSKYKRTNLAAMAIKVSPKYISLN